MNPNILISIIIPIYNGEKFIKKCLKSVLSQTYRNIEVVLVNDGSQDSSLQLCNEIALKDSRVKVISQPNGGSAKARRVGIAHATGEYVMFVDVDDFYCRKDAIETVEKHLAEQNVDLLQFSYQKKLHYVRKSVQQVQMVLHQNRDEFMTNHYPVLLGSYYGGACLTASMYDKAYRRTLFDEVLSAEQTRYIFIGDDVYLNLHILENVRSACFIPNVLYTYQALTGGTKRFNTHYMEDYQVVKDNQLHFIGKYSNQFPWKQDMTYYCHAETAWCVYAQILDIAKHFQEGEALEMIAKCFKYDWVRRSIAYFEDVEIKDTYEPTLQKIRMLLAQDARAYYEKALYINSKHDLKYYLRKIL